MKKQKIIIDCDPGIDDTLALMYAIQHPSLDVIAITITPGNVPTSLGVHNALLILEKLNRLDIPVYAGLENPLKRDFVSAQDTHGIDGLGETHFTRQTDTAAQPTSAVDFLADFFQKPTDVSIIALGPLTNIAKALQSNPKLGKHCQRFVSMGGNFKSNGNCSPVAEYNYWCDPHAAQEVFEKLGKTIEMVGLDVTREIVLTPNLLEYTRHLNQETADFIQQITRFYFDFHWEYETIIGCVINDPLAVAYFINPGICTGFSAYTDISTEGIALGQTVIDSHNFYGKPSNAHILTTVNTYSFWKDFLTTLFHAQIDEELVKKFI